MIYLCRETGPRASGRKNVPFVSLIITGMYTSLLPSLFHSQEEHYCFSCVQETVSTGPFMMRTTCRTCRGAKEIIKNPCTECSGKGKTVQQKRVVVPVPAGVEDGQTVRMPVGSKEIFITFRVRSPRVNMGIVTLLGKRYSRGGWLSLCQGVRRHIPVRNKEIFTMFRVRSCSSCD